MAGTDRDVRLTRQERLDLWVSRALPRLSAVLHREVLRRSGGRIAATKRGIPVGLLTTTGRRSGQPRTVPLMFLPDGDAALVVAANSGQDRAPAWLGNLRSCPEAAFRRPGEAERAVRARVLDAGERARRWPELVRHNPLWGVFGSSTDRVLEVVALEPR